MATFAQYILSEQDFIKKIDIVNFLRKKQNIYFNTSVILKAEIARQFIDTMELDVDRNLALTACLLYSCLKSDVAFTHSKYDKTREEYDEYFKLLGFSDRFCKICAEHSRVGQDENIEREKESDILEIIDQFGGMLIHRSDRLAYSIDEALEILVAKNMVNSNNMYLEQFKDFVYIMEDMQVKMLGLLSRFQKDMNCVTKNDIPGAVRELYEAQERNEKAFAQRKSELRMSGNLLDELKKARAKLNLFEEAPLLPGFEIEDLKEDD